MVVAQLRSLSAVAAVSTVVAVDSLKRIPPEYKQSFFGEYDLWNYIAVYDEVLCDKCREHSLKKFFRGTELRSTFPYLTILDEDRIGGPASDGSGLVHPNCRCELYRILSPERYFRALQKIRKREK